MDRLKFIGSVINGHKFAGVNVYIVRSGDDVRDQLLFHLLLQKDCTVMMGPTPSLGDLPEETVVL